MDAVGRDDVAHATLGLRADIAAVRVRDQRPELQPMVFQAVGGHVVDREPPRVVDVQQRAAFTKWIGARSSRRSTSSGFRGHDLLDAQQEVALAVTLFRYDSAKSNGAAEATALTALIDRQLKALRRAKARYDACIHPSVRWREADLEQAIIEDLSRLRLPSEDVADWFRDALQAALADLGEHQRRSATALKKRRAELANMQDRLLNAYLAGTVDEAVFRAKTETLRAECRLTEETLSRTGEPNPDRSDAALAVFNFSQKAADIWRGSNNAVRREIIDSVCLNRRLDDVTLVTTKRKPFDVLAERPFLKKSRGDWI